MQIIPFAVTQPSSWIRLGIAAVWLVFGLVFKVFERLPRHRAIVARVLGDAWARPLTIAIGLGEAGIGLWMLSGRWVAVCVAVQSAAIIAMNTLEIRRARELLITPWGMIAANTVLLTAGWYVVFAAH